MEYIIDENGEQRFLGNIDATNRFSWPIFRAEPTIEVIPRSQWKELIGDDTGPDFPYLVPIHDQNGIGSCNASATAWAIESCRAQAGLPYVALSAGDLYGRINGGVDRGSMLEDGLLESMRNGIATKATVPYLDWRSRRPEAVEERKRFKVLEAFICPTFDHVMSAVLKGFRIITGIMWSNGYNPDSDGWIPSSGFGGGGHALAGYKATYRGNTFGIWHANSWSERWNSRLQGRLVIGEGNYGRQIGGFWSIRSVTTEEGDVPSPVV